MRGALSIQRSARSALSAAAVLTACYTIEPLPSPPPLEGAERAAIMFVEPEVGRVSAFAWDADDFSRRAWPEFTADAPEPRVHWFTFACDLQALGLDGPFELRPLDANGRAKVPPPVRQLRLDGGRWAPADAVDALLSRLPVTAEDRCRAQASKVMVEETTLPTGRPLTRDSVGRGWVAPLDERSALFVVTVWPDDDEPAETAETTAYLLEIGALRGVIDGWVPAEAASAPSLTRSSTATGVFAVLDPDGRPTGGALWVEAGAVRWLELDPESPPSLRERARWRHPALTAVDLSKGSAKLTPEGIRGLVLGAATRGGGQQPRTLFSLTSDGLVVQIATTTVAADVPFDLIETPDGDVLVRGVAPGVVDGDRLLRFSGPGAPEDAERLPGESARCPIVRAPALAGPELYIGSGPGCSDAWFRRTPSADGVRWAPTPVAPPPSEASARRAGGVLSVAENTLFEERAEVGRCALPTSITPDADYGSWAPGTADDTLVLFTDFDNFRGASVFVVTVAEPGPRCSAPEALLGP